MYAGRTGAPRAHDRLDRRNVKSIVDTQEVPMSLIDFFEANEPMLKSPDRIYPGQNLRIPPA